MPGGRATKFIDVGAGDETRWLRRSDHKSPRLIAFDDPQHRIKLGDHLFGQ
jgi:hypothetical protein